MGWFDDDMRQRDREDFEDGPPGIWRWPEVTPWGTENAEYRIQSESLSANGGEFDDALWLRNNGTEEDEFDDALWLRNNGTEEDEFDDALWLGNNGTEEDEFDDALWMDCEPGEDPFE